MYMATLYTSIIADQNIPEKQPIIVLINVSSQVWMSGNDDQFQASKKTSPLPQPVGGGKVFVNPASQGSEDSTTIENRMRLP